MGDKVGAGEKKHLPGVENFTFFEAPLKLNLVNWSKYRFHFFFEAFRGDAYRPRPKSVPHLAGHLASSLS